MHLTLDKYLDLYANDNSVKWSQIQYKALNKLFELGYKSGHYQNFFVQKIFNSKWIWRFKK